MHTQNRGAVATLAERKFLKESTLILKREHSYRNFIHIFFFMTKKLNVSHQQILIYKNEFQLFSHSEAYGQKLK